MLHYGCRILTWKASPLTPPQNEIDLNNMHIADADVRAALREQAMTMWSLDVECLNFISNYLKNNRVKHVLEFGSGLSTVALSILCRNIAGVQDTIREPCVISIEQNLEHAVQTRQLLEDLKLEQLASVMHSPLIDTNLDGKVFKAYTWNKKHIPYLKDGWLADMIFVDGPTSGELSRALSIIYGLQCSQRDCVVFMDDALRDDEIRCMLYLQKHKQITSIGVIPVGKGIAFSVKY